MCHFVSNKKKKKNLRDLFLCIKIYKRVNLGALFQLFWARAIKTPTHFAEHGSEK